MSESIPGKMLARIYGLGRGVAFTPKDFHDLASHEAARATLSRLTKAGTIRRILRGIYDYPRFSPVLNRPAPPDPDSIARAVARAHGWNLAPEGNTALNLLGLSTQVPAHWTYFSDGPSKTLAWEGGRIVFKRRTNKESSALSPRTALIVQALKALGREHVDAAVEKRLCDAFSKAELTRALREGRYVTAWVYEVMKRLAAKKESGDA